MCSSFISELFQLACSPVRILLERLFLLLSLLKFQVPQYSVCAIHLAIYLIKIHNEALDCRSLCELRVVYVVFLNCLESWCITRCFKKLLVLNILDQQSSGVLSYFEFCKLPGIPVFQVSGKCLTFRGAAHLPSAFKVFSHGAGVAYVICVP